MWLHILRSDVGQGLGHPRQMFGAGDAPDLSTVDDPSAACLVAHYRALADLTDPQRSHASIAAVRDLAAASGDPRLVTLIEVYLAVADLVAERVDEAAAAIDALDGAASDDGYDRYMLHWAGWMTGLAEHDGATARRWMSRQHDYLDRTGIVETWLTTYSAAMCDVIEGGDVVRSLSRAVALADREGYRAEADCLLVLAYAEQCAGRLDTAAELVATAMHARFNATAHHVLYRAVLEPRLRGGLDDAARRAATDRGRTHDPGEVLAAYGVSV